MQSSHGLHTTRGTISKSTARCPPVHASGQQGSGSGGDASKPPAGATRRVTGRDLSRISKIFGPSRRYPAFQPEPTSSPTLGTRQSDARIPPPPPPQQQQQAPSVDFDLSDVEALSAALLKASNWKELAPIMMAHKGAAAPAQRMPAQGLLLFGQRVTQLALEQPPRDKAELGALQALMQDLASSTRFLVSGSAYTPAHLALLLRCFAFLDANPGEGWLNAAQASTIRSMQALLAQQQQQETSPSASSTSSMEDIEALLVMAASLREFGVEPRPDWTGALVKVTGATLELYAAAAAAAAEQGSSASGAPSGASTRPLSQASRRGLIVMPEQKEMSELEPYVVETADGEEIEVVDASPVKPLGPSAMSATSPTASTSGGSSGESVVVVTPSQPGLSPAMWAALSQTVAQYGQQSVSDEWVQAFIDASLPALRASAQEVERAREEGESQGKDGAPLIARALDTTVLSEMLTMLLMCGARPPDLWMEAYLHASQAVLQYICEVDSSTRSGTGGVSGQDIRTAGAAGDANRGGLSARADALGNMLMALNQIDVYAGPAWVSSALIASSLDPTPMRGDSLAALLFEASRQVEGEELSDRAVTAAATLAARCQDLWVAQARQRMTKQRQAASQRPPSVQQAGEDEEEDVTGFSGQGLAVLLIGLARLGALERLPPTWVQAWADDAMQHSDAFDAAAIGTCLEAAAQVGVALPRRLVVELVGRLLEQRAPRPIPENLRTPVSTADNGGSSTATSGGSTAIPLEELRVLVSGLAAQQQQLPSAWLSALQGLMRAHLAELDQDSLLKGLEAISLMPTQAEPDFVSAWLSAYTATGEGLSTPRACILAARGIASVGASPDRMSAIEAPALQCLSRDPAVSDDWANLMAAMAMGGYVPTAAWWEALRSVTSSEQAPAEGGGAVSSVGPVQIGNLLAAYGVLRAVLGGQVPSPEAEAWVASVTQLGLQQMGGASGTCSLTIEQLSHILGGMGALMSSLTQEECGIIESATLTLAPQLTPRTVIACLTIFLMSDHAPSETWLAAALPGFERGMGSAEASDLCDFLNAAARMPPLKSYMDRNTPTLLASVLLDISKAAAAAQVTAQQLVGCLAAAAALELQADQYQPILMAMLDRIQAMREMLRPLEVAQLFKAVLELGLTPPSRWTVMMLRGLEGPALAEAGPAGISAIAEVVDAWDVSPLSPQLAGALVEVLPQLVQMAVELRQQYSSMLAGTPVEGVEASAEAEQQLQEAGDQVTHTSVQVLHLLSKHISPGSLSAPLLEAILSGLAQLASLGGLRVMHHASVAFAVAKLAHPDDDDSIPINADPDTDGSSKSDERGTGEASSSTSVAGVVQARDLLVAVLLDASRSALPSYSSLQAVTLLSGLTALGGQVEGAWLERFFEYSRTKLSELPPPVLRTCLQALAASGAAVPQFWEAALWESLGNSLPGYSLQELHDLVVVTLQPTGLKPPAPLLQRILDTALDMAQERQLQQQQQQSSGAAASQEQQQEESAAAEGLAVASTRGRRRGGTSQSSTSGRDVQPAARTAEVWQPEVMSASPAGSRDVILLASLLTSVASPDTPWGGYQPPAAWLEQFVSVAKPAVASKVLPQHERASLALLVRGVQERLGGQ